MFIRCIVVALTFIAGVALADTSTVATVESPGRVLKVILTLDGDGRPGYAVSRSGAPVIAESRLGFLLNTANARRYIDFAAKNGFRGVLIEGWNEGWDGDWFANGETFSFTRPYPDFDLAGVAAYARRKGVRLIGHHETSANIAHYEQQLAAGLDLYAQLGIDSVKTGYVADAGGVKALGEDGRIHFEWHDGQVMSRHHLKVVTEAAQRHIAVVAYEPIKDTGLRRTYPNWAARPSRPRCRVPPARE